MVGKLESVVRAADQYDEAWDWCFDDTDKVTIKKWFQLGKP